MGNKKQQSGYTLVELLVAVSIFAVVISAAVGIFLQGLKGANRIYGQQAVQESARFILESISKEIRMSYVSQLDGVDYNFLPNGNSGPYSSLSVINAASENVTYEFDSVAKIINRVGNSLSPSNVEATGGFYLLKHDIAQPRITVVLKIKNTASVVSEEAEIYLQTTVSSREYGQF